MDTPRQTQIQEYLEDLIDHQGAKSWTTVVKRKIRKDLSYTFTSSEFLAELAFVDRRIKAACCWFYPEGLQQGDRMTGPKPGDLKPADPLAGDPAPAIDLVNLLAIIRDLQQDTRIKVIQLGDLLEMWIGREFLYRFFPTCDAPLAGNAPRALNLVTSGKPVVGVDDRLQLRRDAGWRDPASAEPTGFKHYVFDPADKWELLERHKTGNYLDLPRALDGLTAEEFYQAIGNRYETLKYNACVSANAADLEQEGRNIVQRLQSLLGQRFYNCYNFCLPLPKKPTGALTAASLSAFKAIDGGNFMQSYQRTAEGSIYNDEHAWSLKNHCAWDSDHDAEFFFNRMILDLLKTVGFINIHGNHDGYRSDPLLKEGISDAAFQAEEVLDKQILGHAGFWCEHGHRWDSYNRDGRFFGAGMTNLVYYQFDNMLKLDARKSWLVDPSEQAGEQPGAAQWFRMIHFLPKNEKGRFVEKSNFAIYASGHTHAADLVRVRFISIGDFEDLVEMEP
ncbi:MAG: metallophosphoesterase [Phycisphaerae bacterium]